ncbi:MAG: efflux RND transporter periplasmic adaptor subunit [Elusimicrobiota bacterium]|jgi:macrolide-specific efflux system membrane fusion protein|nr:efflux RND transporter periplasmic adaptor subunit [Elusimicrobiota bacterium]
MKKKLLIAGIIIVVLTAAFFIFKPSKNQIERQANLMTRDLSIEFRVTGEVSPRNRLEIKPQFAGRIDSILVSEGDAVKKGQTIIRMSSNERAAMLDAARAISEEEFKKWSDIYKESPIIAPMNGFIILRSKEPGQTVTASDPILVMADDLIVEAKIDETDLRHIKIGLQFPIVLDAYPDEKFLGEVEHIAYEASIVSNVTVYLIKIRPIIKPKIFRSGMTATITVTVDSKDGAQVLPSEFIISVRDKTFVYIKSKTSKKIERKEVKTGISDGKFTEIIDGINPDDAAVLIKSEDKTSQRSKSFMTRR